MNFNILWHANWFLVNLNQILGFILGTKTILSESQEFNKIMLFTTCDANNKFVHHVLSLMILISRMKNY